MRRISLRYIVSLIINNVDEINNDNDTVEISACLRSIDIQVDVLE